MTTETIETPAQAADPAPETVETEKPTTEVVEPAAPESQTAAAPEQVAITEPEKPEYMTRADWDREKAEVASRAAADALESDRRRRQTEGARAAAQEKREKEDREEAADVIRASLAAQGFNPEAVSDETVVRTVDRLARKKAERMTAGSLETVDAAFDYLTAPAYGKEVDLVDEASAAASRLGPKLQHFVDTIRPTIEAKAREGYILESELPARIQAALDKKAAESRQGQEELIHANGAPAPNGEMSWAQYMALSVDDRAQIPPEQRQRIMAADRAARSKG